MAISKSATARKPASSKPAARKTTAALTSKASTKALTSKTTLPVPAQKAVASASAAPGKAGAPTQEQRYKMIQDAAYYLAEKNGFQGGAMDYWMAAELEIETMLSRNGKRQPT